MSKNNQKSGNRALFNPNIIIKDINFSSIVLDKKFTDQEQDISFSLDSYLMYKSEKQVIDCSLIGQLLSPSIDNFTDNQLEVVGKYDLKKDLVDLRSIKFISQVLNIDGKLLADIKKDKLSGIIN